MGSFDTAVLTALGLNKQPEDTTEVYNLFTHYKKIKELLDTFEKDTLRPMLFETAEREGITDDKGSSSVQFIDGAGWKKEARHKVTVDQEKAVDLLKQKGLTTYIEYQKQIKPSVDIAQFVPEALHSQVFDTVETVPDTYLEQAYLRQEISDKEFSSLIKRETTYALKELKPKAAKK